MADALSLPSLPFSRSTPASHPPEGSEAEWRHRYRSVLLSPCPLLHGARLACALELPGHLWEQPGCGAGPSQRRALCLALLCLRWHPEPGPGAEKWHGEKSAPMQAQSQQCARCALLQASQEMCTLGTLAGGGSHLPCAPWGDGRAPIPAYSFPRAWWPEIPTASSHPWEMCLACSLPQGAPSLSCCPLPAWNCSCCHSTACCKLVPRVICIGEQDRWFCLREAMSAQVLLAFGGS